MLIALPRIFRTMLNDNDDNEHLVCLLLPLVLMEILFSFFTLRIMLVVSLRYEVLLC